MNIESLVFIDECSINCSMTRLYGRSIGKERVNEYVPDVRFERTSIISSIRLDGDSSPIIFKGTLNGNLFKQYVAECLAPTLKEGDIVILDNLSSHKVAGALDPITAKGASFMFLPPYSPDLNPIEGSWSKMKSMLRQLKPRTFDELVLALKIALESFELSDIKGWFKNCGYLETNSLNN